MFSSLGHKRKFQLLVGLLVLSPFIIYSIAISDTVEAAMACSELGGQYEQIDQVDERLMSLRSQVQKAVLELGMVEGDASAFQSGLLSAVSRYAKEVGLELVDFSGSEIFVEDGMRMETIPVTVEGGFGATICLIHYLETEAKVGRLISTEFKLVKAGRTKKEALRTTIHVQNISKGQ
ncbi:MAG: hypothetical protein GC178_01800 [Flavobacteriales bacterium]|nr:hypothetical protein [Flavobacteriales bacterium]